MGRVGAAHSRQDHEQGENDNMNTLANDNMNTLAQDFRAKALFALTLCAAVPGALATDTVISSDITTNGAFAVASGDTVTVTGNVTSTGDSTTARFDKQGAGTLVLQGDNTFKRIKHSAGKLVFDGGATTVSGGTGSGAGDGMNVLFDGDETVVTGGGSFTVGAGASGTQYAGFRSNRMIVTDGTVDTTAVNGELLCNFINTGLSSRNSSGIVTIGEGGLFRARVMRHFQNVPSNLQDKFGFNVVDGGILEITGVNGLRLDPNIAASSRYGFLHFDGGTLVNSYASGDSKLPWVCSGSDAVGTWANCPITIGEKGMTVKNTTTNNLHLAVPFKSGAANDGGLHITGKGKVHLDVGNATYKGGLHLDSTEGQLVALGTDTALGAVPSTSADNIFVRSSNALLFGNTDVELSANRNIAISSNVTFNVSAEEDKELVIHGEIGGARASGALPTTTRLAARRRWITGTLTNDWSSNPVVLDPGEGRTNNVGRLLVEGNLEIRSGTTLACGSGTYDNAAVRVFGSGSVNPNIATLTVSGGELAIDPSSSSKFFQADACGTVDICGGTVSLNGGEYLNALASRDVTIIRDGGTLDCGVGGYFRVAQQTTGSPIVVRLATNGLLRAHQLKLDFNKNTSATFLFDGGFLQTTVQNGSFCASGLNAKWDSITFAVGPGGAGFDVSHGDNTWIYRPLVSGVAAGETDGGLIARGNSLSWAVVLMTNMTYNGATTVDCCTLQQRAGDNLLPTGTRLVLKNGGIVGFTKYDSALTPTAATLGGISGDGKLTVRSKVAVNGAIAPSIGGTILFEKAPLSIVGPIEIVGDATGCGKVKFGQAQDISTLSLSVPDISAFDEHADKGLYKIVEGNYSGTFASTSGLGDDWAVSYRSTGVYLSHIDAFMLVVR